jgi:hypothetical protein
VPAIAYRQDVYSWEERCTLVTGADGFIGGHLAAARARGKPPHLCQTVFHACPTKCIN